MKFKVQKCHPRSDFLSKVIRETNHCKIDILSIKFIP
jgi:hypothetical protein